MYVIFFPLKIIKIFNYFLDNTIKKYMYIYLTALKYNGLKKTIETFI